jgi:superfamily II DNA or RNA helicase
MLSSVREACLPGLWSLGVKLSRDGAVSLEKRNGAEITCRVREAGKPVAPTVTLYTDDDEWTCDCDSPNDPCAHVAAAAIATATLPAAADNAATPDASAFTTAPSAAAAAKPSARIRYGFARTSGVLSLTRTVLDDRGNEQIISASLASKPPLGFLPTHEDLVVDRIMLAAPQRLVPLARLNDVFNALSNPPPSVELSLDGQPIRVSGTPLFPVISVEDAKRGVALRMRPDERVSEVVARGVVRADDTLHTIGAPELTGDRLEKLPAERIFEKAEMGELVARVIPELERTMTVRIATKRLPKTGARVGPRLIFELSHETHTLSVVPLLVYGDPPQARIDGDRLVHLRGPVPERSPSAERTLVHALRDQLNLVVGRRVDFDGNAASAFAEKLRGFQKRVMGGAERETFEDRVLVPRFLMNDDRFDVVFEVDGDDDDEPRRADSAAVIRAYHDRLSLVPLLGGGWAPLPTDWLSRFGRPLADLLAARQDDKKIPRALLPELARFCDDIGAPRPPGLDRLRPLIEGLPALPNAPAPANLRAELRPYQQVGVSWLSFLRDAELGAILADDMGLGKTLQTIAVLKGRALVVCPKSVVHNWESEILRFRPDLKVSTYHGPKRTLDPDADVTLTTYAVLRLDIAILSASTWDCVVLDEAQTIKNPDSQAAQAAYDLKATFRVALSGTPIENRLDELWSLFHFTNRGLLGGRRHFVDAYGSMATGNPEVAARLRSRIRPFLLRRRKSEVAPELPPRTEAILHVELEDEERTLYDAVKAATRKDVLAALDSGGSVLLALEALLRLRQAACHPSLLPGQSAETSSKINRLVEALEEAALDDHKALVFSQWTSLLDLVEPHLKARGIRFTRLDGSTNDRAGVVNTFQSPDGPTVLLLSLKAGGTGLNLTAADHVFLLDPWWNPAVEDQAADRAHRIGQDRPVMVYRLVARGTVEEGIVALQEKKRALAEAALEGTAAAGGLTRDDLLQLLDLLVKQTDESKVGRGVRTHQGCSAPPERPGPGASWVGTDRFVSAEPRDFAYVARCWSHLGDLNPRPAVYETAALPLS